MDPPTSEGLSSESMLNDEGEKLLFAHVRPPNLEMHVLLISRKDWDPDGREYNTRSDP